MKVTYNWLKEYVDFDWSVENSPSASPCWGGGGRHRGNRRRLRGHRGWAGDTRDQHPNADKLSLCKVSDGSQELQIVCGAQFSGRRQGGVGDLGPAMPVEEGEKPFVIKEGKIRGELSQGMMCSGRS